MSCLQLAMSVIQSWDHALKVDTGSNSHALVNSARTRKETEEVMDVITYDKVTTKYETHSTIKCIPICERI